MNREEYNALFHKHRLNLVAFKPLNDCDEEVLRLVNAAITAEREACAKVCDQIAADYDGSAAGTGADNCATAIRARSEQ